MTIERKSQALSSAIDGTVPVSAVDDPDLRELLQVAKLQRLLGAARRSQAERHREQVWQRLSSVLEDR